MPKDSLLSVVIIAYGWSGIQRDFFETFPTVIIENKVYAEKHPEGKARLIINDENKGFAAAANQGTRLSENSEYVLFLNDDCEITTKQIKQLVETLQQESWQAASPVFVDEHNEPQLGYQQPIPTFFSLVIDWTPLHRFFGKMFHRKEKVLPGGCLLIERNALKQLNGWDERFWLWWEDVDLSYRMSKEKILFGIAENIHVRHIGGESFAPLEESWKKQVFFHSLRLFARKHFSRWQAQILTLITSRFDNSTDYPIRR